jgi:hypothetical protein
MCTPPNRVTIAASAGGNAEATAGRIARFNGIRQGMAVRTWTAVITADVAIAATARGETNVPVERGAGERRPAVGNTVRIEIAGEAIHQAA